MEALFRCSENRAWSFRTVGYSHGAKFWNDFFSMLRTVGYDGVISIEHESPIMAPDEGLSKAVNFLKEKMLFKSSDEMLWV